MSASEAPVFVLSCERAGSTLLRYILDAHPDICAPGEVNLGKLAYDLRYSISFTLELTMKGAPEAERTAFRATEARKVIDAMMSRYTEAKGKKIWCDKSPGNLKFARSLLATFPDARYLLLHRHCLDVVFSCLEISRTGFMEGLWEYAAKNPADLVECMFLSWCDKTEALLELEQRKTLATHRIRYTDIVHRPDDTLGSMFDFLGVAFDPKMVATVFEKPHDDGLGDPKIRYTSRIEQGSVGRGAALTSTLELAEPLRQRANRLLERLEYPSLEKWTLPSAERPIFPLVGSLRDHLLEKLPAQIAQRAGLVAVGDRTYRMVLSGPEAGTYVIGLDPPRVSAEDGRADFTVTLPSDVLRSIIEGRVNPSMAYMQGLIASETHVTSSSMIPLPARMAVRVLRLLVPGPPTRV